MNKQEYIADLSYNLKDLPSEEFEDAIHYIEEYFDEAGVENEQTVIEELGSPAKLATTIRAEATIRSNQKPEVKQVDPTQNNQNIPPKNHSNNGLRTLVIIILGLFALPLALPLLVAIIALAFSLFIVILAFAVSGFAIAVALFIVGIPAIISSISLLSVNLADGLVALGVSLMAFGAGIVFILLFATLIRRFIQWSIHVVSSLFNRLNRKKTLNASTEGESV